MKAMFTKTERIINRSFHTAQQPRLWIRGDKQARLYIPLDHGFKQAGYIDLKKGMCCVHQSLKEEDSIKAKMILSEALKELKRLADI